MFKTGLVEDLPLHNTGFVQQLYAIFSVQEHAWDMWKPWDCCHLWKSVIFVPGAQVGYDLSALQPEQVPPLAVFEEDFPKHVDADGVRPLALWGEGWRRGIYLGWMLLEAISISCPLLFISHICTHLQLMFPRFWLGKKKQEGLETFLLCTLSKFMNSLQILGLPKYK